MGLLDMNKSKQVDLFCPKFLFKDKYRDDFANYWCYTYIMHWNQKHMTEMGIEIKPQESEVESIHWMTYDQIKHMIETNETITSDSVLIFPKVIEWMK